MKKIIIIVGIVVVAGLVIASTRSNPGKDSSQAQNDGAPLTVEEQKVVEQDKAAVVSTTAAVRYTHPRLGFSFEKPEGYTVGSIKGDDGSETLVVQPSGGNAKQGFQIFINPLDEPLDLTPQTVQRELPGTAVDNPLRITLDGVKNAMMFGSNNESFGGKSYEIWFATNSYVYQVTSYAEFAKQLQQIIGTWKF